MKLHATNIPARDYRRISLPILGLTHNNLIITWPAIKRMHEITERPVFDTVKQRMLAFLMNSIPSNLWHDELVSTPPHIPLQQPKPRRRSKFIRLFKQHLHPNANTEQWRSLTYLLTHQSVETSLRECLHTRTKRPDTRQHQSLRSTQSLFVTTDDRVTTGRRKSLLNRPQVANAIVNDCNAAHSDPFVLGTPTTRLFLSTALRNARDVALNVPSRM